MKVFGNKAYPSTLRTLSQGVGGGSIFFLINVQQIPRNGYGGETKKIIKIIIKEPLQNFRFVGQIIIIFFLNWG